jgi:hypothetical protein
MFDAVRHGVRLMPAVARKPAVLWRWLVGARGAQVAASALLVFALFGLPLVLDELERAFPPPESRSPITRFFDRVSNRPDPRLEERRKWLTSLTWSLGVAGVAALSLASLPRAAARAAEDARAFASRGDSLATASAAESLMLYRAAHALSWDSAAEAELAAKLGALFSSNAGAARTVARVTPDADLRALRAAETQLSPVRAPSGEPQHVGPGQRYRLQKVLGRGGMGVVYQAFDTALEREVALKALPAHLLGQTELARRFKQEARVLARLDHPNIVRVHDLVEDGEQLWIALELVKGGTLADAMARAGGALPWWQAVGFAGQIAAGLDHAHAEGVIHRDIKPINVLLTQEEGGVAKITDFGLARHATSSVHTQAGTVLGSARYMSPEQAAGRPSDARSDLYSFGVTLYELLAGRPPFEGDVPTLLVRHLSQPPPPLRSLRCELPEPLAALTHALLAKDPEQRPATLRGAREVFEALLRDDATRRTEA